MLGPEVLCTRDVNPSQSLGAALGNASLCPGLGEPHLEVQGLRAAGPTPVVMTQSTSRVWCSWLKKSGLDASSFLS